MCDKVRQCLCFPTQAQVFQLGLVAPVGPILCIINYVKILMIFVQYMCFVSVSDKRILKREFHCHLFN